MTCDIPEPCKSPSHDSRQKKFLWTHKEVDLAPHSVVGSVLQVGDAEKFAAGWQSVTSSHRYDEGAGGCTSV